MSKPSEIEGEMQIDEQFATPEASTSQDPPSINNKEDINETVEELCHSIREWRPTKWSRGLNFNEEINIAIWLTEFNTFKNELDDDPLLFSEAMSYPDWKLWKDAIETEISNLKERGI